MLHFKGVANPRHYILPQIHKKSYLNKIVQNVRFFITFNMLLYTMTSFVIKSVGVNKLSLNKLKYIIQYLHSGALIKLNITNFYNNQ